MMNKLTKEYLDEATQNKPLLFNMDCIDLMKLMDTQSIDCVFTDIPYGEVNANADRRGNPSGLRKVKNLDKGDADILTFDLTTFLHQVYRIVRENVVIFCGQGQSSEIYNFFKNKDKGSTRTLVWRKTNPSPFNGQYIYLSGIELAIWHKKPKGTFNAFCKNTVFDHPTGTAKLHPTEKNHNLLEEIMRDITNEGQLVFDPCAGSFSTGVVAQKIGRRFIGNDISEEYYNIGLKRLNGEATK